MRTDRKVDVPFRTQQFVILAAQAGSFHKAARALGVDPSSIVRSINRLERDLGVKIFERTRQRFTVTNAGASFVREIIEAVAHVERACDLSRYRAQIDQGPLRIGYSTYAHSRLIPILETLEVGSERLSPGSNSAGWAAAPGASVADSKLALESGTTVELAERVQRGSLHASFGVTPIPGDRLSIHPITREPFSLSVSKNHRLAKQPSVLARDLDGETVFLFPRPAHPLLYDRTLEYIASTGANPRIREVLSLTHTMEIVAHNFGVALLPRAASRFSCMGVLFKPIADKLLWIETALFYCVDQQDTRLPLFLDELLSQTRRQAWGI
ncbi:MAG: LysR family transcriptional regulator [Silvibacterium sp.]